MSSFQRLFDYTNAAFGVDRSVLFMEVSSIQRENDLCLFVYHRRIPMSEVPEGHDELCDYCYKLYQHKVMITVAMPTNYGSIYSCMDNYQ